MRPIAQSSAIRAGRVLLVAVAKPRVSRLLSTSAKLALASASGPFSSTGMDPIAKAIFDKAHEKQTAVSLQALSSFGSMATGDDEQKRSRTLIHAACFLHRELPIRFAHRIQELQHLPYGLGEMPSIRAVAQWYRASFAEILSHALPSTPEAEASFCRLLEGIYERHNPTLVTMARGIHEFRAKRFSGNGGQLPWLMEAQFQSYLDGFFSSRIGIRTLISHYAALHHPPPPSVGPDGKLQASPWVGIINSRCNPAAVIADAAADAKAVCERVLGDAPEVEILGAGATPDEAFAFSFVPSYLHHIAFELLKNSMRAVVETHNRQASMQARNFAAASMGGGGGDSEIQNSGGTPPGVVRYPPIRVIISAASDSEDVTIKIADEGGGIPRSGMRRIFRYFYSTAPSASAALASSAELPEDSGAQDFSRGVPLAGLGVGLPLSRLMARWFGGDLAVMSLDRWGTDAFVFLRRLGDTAEPLTDSSYQEGQGWVGQIDGHGGHGAAGQGQRQAGEGAAGGVNTGFPVPFGFQAQTNNSGGGGSRANGASPFSDLPFAAGNWPPASEAAMNGGSNGSGSGGGGGGVILGSGSGSSSSRAATLSPIAPSPSTSAASSSSSAAAGAAGTGGTEAASHASVKLVIRKVGESAHSAHQQALQQAHHHQQQHSNSNSKGPNTNKEGGKK